MQIERVFSWNSATTGETYSTCCPFFQECSARQSQVVYSHTVEDLSKVRA